VPAGGVELEAPRGVLLRVLAADATGLQGEAELEIALDREEATVAIELAPAPPGGVRQAVRQGGGQTPARSLNS
jgi:hypothetical protein